MLAEREQNNEARRAVLTAIQRHLAASAPFDVVYNEHHAQHKSAGPTIVASNAQRVSSLERFKQSLEAVGGHCLVVQNESDASKELQKIIEKIEAKRIVISDSSLVRRVMNEVKTNAELLEAASKTDLFNCDAGITSAQWAIAETGTLALESAKERHRLSSLVPPVHIAVIEAGKIRQTLSEVLESVSERGKDELSRAVTFITGPSRTSDIELTLAIGVHGPGELFVIVIEGGATNA
jgi:L-lactate dehydrogenase complex protein LldG